MKRFAADRWRYFHTLARARPGLKWDSSPFTCREALTLDVIASRGCSWEYFAWFGTKREAWLTPCRETPRLMRWPVRMTCASRLTMAFLLVQPGSTPGWLARVSETSSHPCRGALVWAIVDIVARRVAAGGDTSLSRKPSPISRHPALPCGHKGVRFSRIRREAVDGAPSLIVRSRVRTPPRAPARVAQW